MLFDMMVMVMSCVSYAIMLSLPRASFQAEAFYLCLESLWAAGDLPGFAVHSMSLGVRSASRRGRSTWMVVKVVNLPR